MGLASVNFVGTGVTATTVGDDATVTVTGGTNTPELTVRDEGNTVDSNVGNMNFVGDSVTVTNAGAGGVTVTIEQGTTPPPVTPAHANIQVSSSLTEGVAPFTGSISYTVTVTSSNPSIGTFTFVNITNATSALTTPAVSNNVVTVATLNTGVGTYRTSFTVNYRDGDGVMYTEQITRTFTVAAPWFAGVSTTVPANNAALTSQGIYASGRRVTLTGSASNPTAYIALPTGTYNFRTGLAFIVGTRVTSGYTQNGFELYSFGAIGAGETITIEVQDG